jgi:hypothetical protein
MLVSRYSYTTYDGHFDNVHVSPLKKGLNVVKKSADAVANRIQNYEMGYKRIRTIRAQITQAKIHQKPYSHFDDILSNPAMFRSSFLRGLINTAKGVEEVAETCADISSVTEKLFRNMFSSGKKSDLAQIAGAATGRYVSGLCKSGSFAINKMAGSGLYGLASLLSGIAILLAYTPLGAQRSQQEIAELHKNPRFDWSMYTHVAKACQKGKEHVLKRIENTANQHLPNHNKAILAIVRRLSRKSKDSNAAYARMRRSNCSYMWKNQHQYDNLNKTLLKSAYFTFNIANKAICSYDKHLGLLLSDLLVSKAVGKVLGTRLSMTITVGAAAVVSYYMAPFLFSLSTIGAMACGVAFLMLLAAKVNAHYFGGWKGNLEPY